MTYKNELRELYESYSGKELEKALGISQRSMQNYLKEDDPRTPKPEIQTRIHEAFANHRNGKPLGNVEQEGDMDTESRRTLERTLENLSEDKIRSTVIIERLVTMLEKQFKTMGPELPPPGTPGTETLKRKKSAH
jgi:hypothetical protein